MYTALNLSRYIVSKCIQDCHPISNLQLQKILFFIQKEFLSNGCPAFNDRIEAWQFGPVIPVVYYTYCGYGAMPITTANHSFTIHCEDRHLIDKIIVEKRTLSPWELVKATHRPGGAWDKVYQYGVGNHQIIPIDLIKRYG